MVFAHIFFEKRKFSEKLSRGRKPFCAKFFGTPFSERRRDFTFLLKREDFLKSFQGAENFLQSSLAHLSPKEGVILPFF